VEAPDIRGQWNANAAAWTEMSRAGFDRYRDLVNTPGFFALLLAVDGLTCLDLGCGEGHNTRLLAGRGARVVAVDIAESFIAAAAGIPHQGIRYLVGDGALLPFRAASFDAVTAFMSLMDTADPELTLREVARVLRPGGAAALIDNVVPENIAAARHINALEKLRDPSHNWAYTAADWLGFFAAAGLEVTHCEIFRKTRDFDYWNDTLGVDEKRRAQLRVLMLQAPAAARAALEPVVVGGTLQFKLTEILVVACKAA